MLLVTRLEKKPDEGATVLKALFDTWFDVHPGRHPFERDTLHDLDFYSLGQIAQKSPLVFISGTIDALLRSIDEINQRGARGDPDYSFEYRTFRGTDLVRINSSVCLARPFGRSQSIIRHRLERS